MHFARRKRNSLTITLLIKFLLKDWKEHAEADCFFCFTNLMSDIRFFFLNQNNSTAIRTSGTSSSRPWTTPPVGSRPLWPDLQRGSNHKKPQPHHRNHRKAFFHFYDLGIDPHFRLKEVDQVSADILNEQVGVSKLNVRHN